MIKAVDIVVGYPALRRAQGPVAEPVEAAETSGAVAGPLSFCYNDGVCVMLKGRNGSGKTTLMKTLAGMLKPVSGSFETGGEAILVPTRIPKVKGFSVEEFVRTGMLAEYGSFRKPGKEAEKTLEDAIRMMDLEALAYKDISRISDGEFQRACIAAALTRKANVLMLDEPTAFLDVDNRIMVLQTLQRLAHETGTTIVFSTHDIHDGALYSDSVLGL